ncbi:MAG: WG repeat-containing protein [Prevotellaceae bacterium]|nr:WG repeat-containing protein [Prevotellaceae bacterium]
MFFAVLCLLCWDMRGQKLFPQKTGGKWCYVDANGATVVPPKYDGAHDFSEGIAMVYSGEKYGFINDAGKEITPFKYDEAYDFRGGLARVAISRKYGFIDETGREVIPLKYEAAENASEGVAIVRVSGRYGYIDKSGRILTPFKYAHPEPFSEGMALVTTDYYQTCGYIDKSGREVVPVKYSSREAEEKKTAYLQQIKTQGRNVNDVAPARNVIANRSELPQSLVEQDVTLGHVNYSSNFNDNVFDADFWKKELGSNSNNVIRVENGIMKLEQNKTDVTPHLISKDLSFDSDITMERDIYLQKANDYLYANMTFSFNNKNQIQISYFCTNYEENYKEGIHLIQNGQYTNLYKNIALDFKADKNDQGRGYRMNLPINTILDKWFHEKIIISKSGTVSYFVNNKEIGSYDLSQYLNLSSASTFNVAFTPTGWWTGHKHYFDNFKLYEN